WRTFCWIVLPEASSTRRGASMAGGRRGRTARTAPPARARSTITSRKVARGTPPPLPLFRMRTPGRRYTRRRLSLSCRPTSHPSCRSRPPLPSMPLSPTHHLRHRHVPSGRRRPRPDRRRRPAKPPAAEPAREQKKKKPLERATPLPPAPAVTEALDDLEQELARSCVQDLLHALAPPPSSLPLPRFSLVVKASPHSATAGKVAPAAPSCNAEAATADGLRRLLRL
uniref:Uncharacterized protein n=1 Tax=Aegilops tauschii subsp. strangulata TaxID=200361 RepID=A0A453IJ46_AEGTS